jgi:hypothetical protein
VFTSGEQHARQNHNLKISNKSYDTVVGFKCFGTTLTKIEFKKKDKAASLQAWSGPEVFRKLRFPDFMTTAQDGGKVVSLKHRPPLPPENTPGTHFC